MCRSRICSPDPQATHVSLEREETVIDCPYCGEPIDVLLDPAAADQQYTEDCQVCCRPIIFNVATDGRSARVHREDD